MRIDPKYFNLFIIICAVIAVIVITLSTIRYSNKQVFEFQHNISEIQLSTLVFRSYLQPDSVHISDFADRPIVIQFWSTWSGKSNTVNSFLNEYQMQNPHLIVIAAAVRDGEEQILEYIQAEKYDFLYVEGTGFYQQIYVPGMPVQILIDKNGQLFDTHIGDEIQNLKIKLNSLINYEE